MRDIAAGNRGDKGTLAVLYAPWCQFCQVGPLLHDQRYQSSAQPGGSLPHPTRILLS